VTARAFSLCLAVLAGFSAAASELSIPTTTPQGTTELIPATVSHPEGAGPFPAIVVMHDCSGLGPGSSGAPGRWAKELVSRGYVVVTPDSFSSRGRAAGVCTDASPGRFDVRPGRRVRDAHAALAFARSLPCVDAQRVGLMGGSHGGTTTLLSMSAQQTGFAAAVALYPRCATASGPYRTAAPVLILIGDRDDWTPVEPCRRFAEAAQAAGQPVSIRIYPGAHHSFDSARPVRYVEARINPASPSGRGATTGGNAEAWADSIRQVDEFFRRNLK
jgi:dienelactone hydrolase